MGLSNGEKCPCVELLLLPRYAEKTKATRHYKRWLDKSHTFTKFSIAFLLACLTVRTVHVHTGME